MTIEPYEFQHEAVDTMSGLPGFLLADEMGLGKTITALWEVRLNTTPDDPVLILCPKTVIPVWEEHVATLLPNHTDVTITNYEQVVANPGRYLPYPWVYIIADEAHYIKNRTRKRTKALKRLKTKYKRALTGTPIINRPDELWSILNWLAPSRFRSYWKFFEMYVKYWQHPIQGYKKVLGPKNVEQLREEIADIFLRRKKMDVLKDLPEKYYTIIPVKLHPQQQRAYNEMKKESLAWVGEHEQDPIAAPMVVARLVRLRQFAAAYAEVTEEGVRLSEPSAKLDALMELVGNTDQKIVVFSQFKQMIRLAEGRLRAAKETFVTLTGDTSQSERRDVVARFQTGDARIFLGTVGAGGVGITLHAASMVVFLDRSWSPADNLQAEDRLHRIGQRNAVQVVTLQAENTVDQVVEDKLQLKWSWIRAILEGEIK